jgi:hypothetical protein
MTEALYRNEITLLDSYGINSEKLKAIERKNKQMLRWLFVLYTLLMLAIAGLYIKK